MNADLTTQISHLWCNGHELAKDTKFTQRKEVPLLTSQNSNMFCGSMPNSFTLA